MNVLFLLWISFMYHPHKRVRKKEPGLTFIRSLLYHSLDQLNLSLKGGNKSFLDLSHMLLYVTIQLVISDGSELDGGAKVDPVNLSFHSLFGQLDISMNGRIISDRSSSYPAQAYLETLLSYGEEAKSTHLTSSLFYKDTTGKMYEPNPTKGNADVTVSQEG